MNSLVAPFYGHCNPELLDLFNMKAIKTEKADIKIIGIEVRTNNQAEMSPEGKIGPTWNRFYQENIAAKIPNQSSPEKLFAIYMDYESDFRGEYAFVLGKEVGTFDIVPEGMVAKTLPTANYAVFTSEKGAMPNIVINLWKHIWALKPTDTGGDRAYKADFEVYDNRSADPQNSQVDVYISIK